MKGVNNKSGWEKDLQANHYVDFLISKKGREEDFPNKKITKLTFLISKKGQMELSFGMIFSIILIIVFIAVAFFGIKKFIEFKDASLVSEFYNDFNNRDVDAAYKGLQSDATKQYNLPGKIEKVCFLNCNREYSEGSVSSDVYEEVRFDCGLNSDKNLFLYPRVIGSGLDSLIVKHLNITKITERANPYCAEVVDRKLTLKIKKEFGENLVVITTV